MRLVGRCAHVLKSFYNEKPAVVKILWTPKDRITEGAVYAIIHESKVPSIPAVYDSGILKENVFGYRLEYLVMEDCGKPIVDFAKMGYGRGRSLRGANLVSTHVSQASTCLASAYTAGVLHRDISSGNITIDEPKNARIIDWGFAKVFKAQSADVWEKTRTTLEKWYLDPELVVSNENHYDRFTGTPLYMSIQMLLGSSKRGLIHDLESLFYVILHVLSDDSDKARGFKFFDSFALASSRAAYLGDKSRFFEAFGVGDIDKELRGMLNAMYSFLFVQKGEYIGIKLLYDQDYERHYSREFAIGFMDKSAAELMCDYDNSDSNSATDAAAATKKRKLMSENDTENVEPSQNKRS
ncbi:kinase-like domain-containing protein [Coemansia spiralis]|nr:kinase-like domain-containing protein [Coemansia spiralis]